MIKHDILMMNLISAVYWFDEALQVKLERMGYPGLSRTQSLLLANLAAGEHRAIRIASNLGVSRQAISQILADLEARNVVTLRTDPEDRRARIVEFHPDASELRTAASAILTDLEMTVAKRIGRTNFNAMRKALAADWGGLPDY